MIDEVRLAYAALATHGTAKHGGLVTLGIDSVEGTYVAMDEHSRQHLLLQTESKIEIDPGVTTLGISTRTLQLVGGEILVLDVTCLFASLSEVFDHFAAAVIQRIADAAESPADAVISVLAAWRNFLVPPAGPPSLDKIAATLGELLVVRDAVKNSGRVDIGFWSGPFGQRHDLRGGRTAMEVKTTRAHTGYRVTIHGEDQMLPPEDGHLYLHFFRLESVHQGKLRLTAVVDELLDAGVSAEQLFRALSASGVPPGDLSSTDNTTFDALERVTFPVDDQTPRIVPSSFSGGQRPQGVVDITYVVDLSHTAGRALGEDEYKAVTATLALGPTAW
ncbi:PD-(D/E)XK motif protein [Rhodococcus sp. AH-ZY2]|uniref:PD-(D/E)XK motif protein n=1 Tax=Rhodococcus sp. AH-ZY2 TaxID=3047468 RepID=UPI0027E06DC9|nr:PD-(D/E)XK motif protein [Rhodococcus sp. AH-ZY2]WML64546.1 PD-(D/E)XK motif protein [Rhodococcus sp. AH-ZY2]